MNAARELGKVAVLLGGRSGEREISIRSGNAVIAALRARGVDTTPFDPQVRGIEELKDGHFDRVFIALHGRYGEDGTVQGALELMDIPYTGSGVMASALALDKWRSKLVWMACGIPTPRFVVLTEVGMAEPGAADSVARQLGLPLIVKPAREGSTLGLTKVTAAADLLAAYEKARELDDLVLAEEFIDGIELTAAILNDAALPLIWIEAPGGNYDYHAKYFSDETRYHCPSGLPPAQEQAIQDLALRAYRVLGCEGWGRVDVMLNRSGEPFLLEANTVPGMTDHSLVPMAARASGIAFDELVLRILAGAHVG
jgi:D-alanine-D-alanine ligase